MKSAGLFKKIIVYILLTCFIFPTHALYGAAISSKEDKDPFVNFKKQHSKYIKEYISLDISDVKDVSKYLVKISSYIKKTVDSGLIYDISKETDERYWSEDINQSWLSLLVLQYKLAEYIDLIKSSVDQEAVIAELTNTKIDNFRSYLYTLYRNVDDVLAENPDITVTELETGEKAIRYPGVEASTNTAVTQDEVLLPTGLAFPESLIKEKTNWGDLAGILENYESEKYTTIIGIQLGLDLNEFIKSKNYNKMKEYKKAIFEGARAFLRAKPGAVTRIANLMALQQLYENLYFEALGNALRIYMDNIYVYKASTDFSRLNEEGIKELAELACPLIDERKTSDTDYRTAEYARYRCIKKNGLSSKGSD